MSAIVILDHIHLTHNVKEKNICTYHKHNIKFS